MEVINSAAAFIEGENMQDSGHIMSNCIFRTYLSNFFFEKKIGLNNNEALDNII